MRVLAPWVALVTLSSILAAAPAASEPALREVWLDGEHVVRGSEVHEDEVIHANGTILVAPGAELVLRHVTLIFEGDGQHALGVQPRTETPAGTLRLESTAAGSTWIKTESEDVRYFFSSFGRFEAQGVPGSPVIIENVSGSSGGLAPDAKNLGTFINGMQLIGPHNALDRVLFHSCPSGIGVSSQGETRITNTSIGYVNVPVYLHHAKNVLIDRSQLAGIEAGIFANEAENVTVTNSILQALDNAVMAHASTMAFVNDTISSKEAAHVFDGGAYSFLGSNFTGYKETGIHTHQSTLQSLLHLDVVGSTFDGRNEALNAITVEQAGVVRLEGNTFADHTADGVTILQAAQTFAYNNTALRNDRIGIEIFNSVFREDATWFGAAPEDRNGRGGFVGSTTVRVRVEDANGQPVPNATVVFQPAEGEPIQETTGSKGTLTTTLEALSIANDGARAVRKYDVKAIAPGHPDGRLTIQPYTDGNEFVVQLSGAEVESLPGPGGFSGAGAWTILAAIGVVLVAGVVVLSMRRRPKSP